MDLFPYEPRLFQRDLVEFVRAAARSEAHGVVESGTGTGKTVCALAGTLPEALARGKRILYLTRTNSQQRQVVVEFRRIRERHSLTEAGLVALQGRTHLCPLRREEPEMERANAEELAVMCRDRCKAVERERAGEPAGPVPPCRFFRASDPPRLGPFVAWAKDTVPTAEELVAEAGRRGLCPYEATKALVADARVVVAPYVYLFHAGLRRAFLTWANARTEDFLVVIDEAHNLPDYARELASARLGRTTLARAKEEALRHGNPEVGGTRLLALLNHLDGILVRLAEEHLPPEAEDALVPPDAFETELLSALTTTTVGLRKSVGVLLEYAEAVRESKRKEGKVPRSHVGAVGSFLMLWLETNGAAGPFGGGERLPGDGAYAHLLVRDAGDEEKVRLECYALDPSSVTRIVLACAGSLHMSGTLRPLAAYRETVGLPSNTPLRLVPSPFPPENRPVLVDPEVTTRYEEVRRAPDMWARIGQRLAAVRAATDRNLMVFAPSYEVLGRLAPYIPGATLESPGLPQEELMARVAAFKAARGATFGCVLGGRVAEGLDFPDEELEVAVVAGLPYPKPTARQRALERYYDLVCGQGFEIASRAPMLRKTLQALGRVVRSPTDRGAVVVLDKRAVLLADEIDALRVERDAAGAVRAFFQE